jgi:hypothetical protein
MKTAVRMTTLSIALGAPCAMTAVSAAQPLAVELASSTHCAIPAGTPVIIETSDPVDSKMAKPGDKFAISLAEPLMLNGIPVLPAGMSGRGEVIHAQSRQGFSGRAGELILAARYLESGSDRWPLRGFRISKAGAQTAGIAIVGTVAISTLQSRDIRIPAGSRAEARLAATIPVACHSATPGSGPVDN